MIRSDNLHDRLLLYLWQQSQNYFSTENPFRVRFNGTNVECEFSKDELIGQNLSDVCSKRLQPDQNVYVVVDGKETIGIIRSIEPSGDYNVAIEGRIVTINKSDIRLLKNSMNIRNRTQSDATAANRRHQNRLQNQSRSKDEFDVARTLANFSETAINFDSDRQSGSSEREKTLNQLSHDRRSVICENPGSIHTNQSVDMDEDMNEDTDDDIDVEAIDDPLADVDGVCDDNLMDTDQPEIIHRHNPDEDNKPKPHTVTQTLNLNQNVIHVIQMPVSTGQGTLPTTLQATPIQVVDSSGFYSSSPVIAMKNLQIGTPVGTPISNSPQPAFQANPIPIAMTPPVYNATIVHSPNTAPIAITTANREIYNRVALMEYGRPEYRLSPQFTTASPFSPNSPKMATSAPSGQPLRIGAQHTKVRGDGKKCRKIHGVNNRHLWCNACRWKKACVAFPD